jgi:hypothetical protein
MVRRLLKVISVMPPRAVWGMKGLGMMRILSGMAVTLAVFLGGCAGRDFRAPGVTGYQWHGSMLADTKLKSEEGTFVTATCPAVFREREWVTFSCRTVTVQADPPGLEAYSYVYKVKIKSLTGIPYGELPVTAYVVGGFSECQRISAAHNARLDGRVNEGNLRLSADPAERCLGPFYIRSTASADEGPMNLSPIARR